MRVEGAATRRSPCLLGAEQTPGAFAGIGELGTRLVEDLRDGTPARPAAKHGLLIGRRRSPVAETVEDFERSEVRVELGGRTGRGEVTLSGWTKRYESAWKLRRRWRLTQSSIASGLGSIPRRVNASGAWA